MKVERIPLDAIDPPAEANRMEFAEGEMVALIASIKAIGLINPITVRQLGTGRYEVVAGHRRWQALKSLGEAYIDAIITMKSKLGRCTVKFAENNIRAGLTPFEEGIALNEMLAEQGEGIESLTRQVGRSRTWVDGRLALLSYPEDLQKAVQNEIISMSAAAELNYVTDAPHRAYLMQYAIESGVSAGVMRQWRTAWQQSQATNPQDPPPRPEMGELGEPPTVMIPCAICTKAVDHMHTQIIRCCDVCHHDLMVHLRGQTT